VSKKLTIFNFSFSIISDKKNCKSSFGHYIVGAFEITETYENLQKSLEQIISSLETLKRLSINQHEFDLDIKFANDLKVTSLLMGITAANSKYPCPYCKISFPVNNKGEFSVIEKDIGQFKKSLLDNDWSLDTATESATVLYRTSEEAASLIHEISVEAKKGLLTINYIVIS